MTINQLVVYGFAVVFIVIALAFGLRYEQGLCITTLIIACLLVIVAAVDPVSIANLGLKHDKGGTQFGVSRHVPAQQEIEQVFVLPDGDLSSYLADDPLVTAARERDPGLKAATDFLLLATEAWKEKRYDEGLSHAFQGLALEHEDRRIKASLEYRIGTLFAEIADINYAIKFYERAIQTDRSFAGPHINLGSLLRVENRTEEAEAAYRKAIELEPESSFPYNNLGNLLAKEDRSKEAETAYRKAIELEPEYAAAYNNLGNLLAKEDRSKEAEAAYRKAIELEPEFYIPYINLGNLLRVENRTEEAEAAYRKGIALNPKDAKCYHNLGNLLADENRTKEAEAAYRKAIALDPKDAKSHHRLGNLLADENRTKETAKHFAKGKVD